MKVYKQSCALCGKNKPEILFPASFKRKINPYENIVICTNCGLVYKYPIVPESEIIHYMTVGHWKSPYFDKKLNGTADFISKKVPCEGGSILDIGAAAGHLLNHLSKRYPKASLTGLEPSKNACNEAKVLNKKLKMVTATIETATLPKNSFDLITAIGVDYLFLDHVKGLIKINDLLCPTGVFYIERNVFLTSKAYVSTAINNRDDLFGMNAMMKNWFTKDQMTLQLSKFFEVIGENAVVSNIVKGHKNIHYGWLCKKRTQTVSVNIPNKYKENKNYILKRL
jgi:SAM-dependent methyltransferase